MILFPYSIFKNGREANMIVTVKYLGPLRKFTGRSQEDIDLKEPARLSDLFKKLEQNYGEEFRKHLSITGGDISEDTLILINGRTLRRHRELLGQFLSEQDVLSILPLYLSGG